MGDCLKVVKQILRNNTNRDVFVGRGGGRKERLKDENGKIMMNDIDGLAQLI